MNAREYQQWMRQAFLYTEGVLATELASATRVCMTEEFLRSSLLRGLIMSMPSEAFRVAREMTADWCNNECFFDAAHVVGGGRPIQHDAGIRPNEMDRGLACEVKWLPIANASSIAQDILKLALSRSTEAEGQAMRSYLLIGGTSKAIPDTLSTLRAARFNFRWARAGAGDAWPAPTTIQIQVGISGHALPSNALEKLISWGTPRHMRRCPDTWASLRASLRARWYRTVVVNGEPTGWRLLLWELDHWGIGNQSQMDWASVMKQLGRQC